MKCRAEAVRKDQLVTQVMRMYGTRVLEVIEAKCAEILLDEYPWFRRGDRLQAFFREQADELEYRLNRNVPDHMYVKDRRGRREADTAETFSETVDGTLYDLRRDMIAEGLDADRLMDACVAYAPDTDALGRARDHRQARIAWYAYNGRSAVQGWIGSTALALWAMRYPCGKRRFGRARLEKVVLLPIAAYMAKWIEDWFEGYGQIDRRMDAEQRERLARLKRVYDVELSPADGREAAT